MQKSESGDKSSAKSLTSIEISLKVIKYVEQKKHKTFLRSERSSVTSQQEGKNICSARTHEVKINFTFAILVTGATQFKYN